MALLGQVSGPNCMSHIVSHGGLRNGSDEPVLAVLEKTWKHEAKRKRGKQTQPVGNQTKSTWAKKNLPSREPVPRSDTRKPPAARPAPPGRGACAAPKVCEAFCSSSESCVKFPRKSPGHWAERDRNSEPLGLWLSKPKSVSPQFSSDSIEPLKWVF